MQAQQRFRDRQKVRRDFSKEHDESCIASLSWGPAWYSLQDAAKHFMTHRAVQHRRAVSRQQGLTAFSVQAKLKEAEDAAAELEAKLAVALEEKRQLQQRVTEFMQTLAERDELIAQLRAGTQVAIM